MSSVVARGITFSGTYDDERLPGGSLVYLDPKTGEWKAASAKKHRPAVAVLVEAAPSSGRVMLSPTVTLSGDYPKSQVGKRLYLGESGEYVFIPKGQFIQEVGLVASTTEVALILKDPVVEVKVGVTKRNKTEDGPVPV